MRPIILVLAATLALLALCGWAIGKGDRQTFARGPDVAAETFVESVLLRRGDPAREYLADDVAARVSSDSLIAIGRAIQQRRKARDAEGNVIAIDSAKSLVRVDIHFEDGGTSELELPMRWESGQWHVQTLAPIERWIAANLAPETRSR